MINNPRDLLCQSQQQEWGNKQWREAISEFQQNSDRVQKVVQEMLQGKLFCYNTEEDTFVEVYNPKLSHDRVTIIRLWHEHQFSKMLKHVFPNSKMYDDTLVKGVNYILEHFLHKCEKEPNEVMPRSLLRFFEKIMEGSVKSLEHKLKKKTADQELTEAPFAPFQPQQLLQPDQALIDRVNYIHASDMIKLLHAWSQTLSESKIRAFEKAIRIGVNPTTLGDFNELTIVVNAITAFADKVKARPHLKHFMKHILNDMRFNTYDWLKKINSNVSIEKDVTNRPSCAIKITQSRPNIEERARRTQIQIISLEEIDNINYIYTRDLIQLLDSWGNVLEPLVKEAFENAIEQGLSVDNTQYPGELLELGHAMEALRRFVENVRATKPFEACLKSSLVEMEGLQRQRHLARLFRALAPDSNERKEYLLQNFHHFRRVTDYLSWQPAFLMWLAEAVNTYEAANIYVDRASHSLQQLDNMTVNILRHCLIKGNENQWVAFQNAEDALNWIFSLPRNLSFK